MAVRSRSKVQQAALFDAGTLGRALPVVGEQKDIQYFGSTARSVLNDPETTKMGFWSINPYVGCAFGCAYCYARYAHRYVAERKTMEGADESHELTELPSWLAFERRIFVKRNAAEVLRETLRGHRPQATGHSRGQRPEARGQSNHAPGPKPQAPARLAKLWQGESIVIGTATDPYQPAERQYRVTRGVLEVLAEEKGLSVTVITKSALITRDIDVLRELSSRSGFTIHLSLITLDRELARRIEPRAPTPEARVRALERLANAGIDVGINVMPVLPGITDRPAMLDAVIRRVRDAGASYINACALRLQSAARTRYLPFIDAEFPRLSTAYRTTYSSGYQVGDAYREGLSRFMRERCRKYGIAYGSWRGDRDDEEAENEPEVPESDQLLLTLNS